MKWLRRLFERRQVWPLSQLQSWSEMGIGSGPTAAGITVTPELAASVPAVYACLSVLGQDISKTPVKLRRMVGPGTFEDAIDHPLWELLHDLPNPETTAYQFKLALMFDLLMHERTMAVHAVVLKNAAVLRRHHDRLVKILERERLRMVEAVFGLGEILAEETVRQMAVDAHRDAVMAGLLPGIVLRLHDVAVHADPRVVAHVREALGVQEREAANAGEQADQHRQDKPSAGHG